MDIYGLIVMVALIGYLFGSVNFGIIIGKVFYNKDLRQFGSKNAGATNAGRVFGKHAFFIVMILDILKGVLAYFVALTLLTLMNNEGGLDFTKYNLAQFAAVGAFVGHLFPLYYKFKGGKGATTGFATIAVVNPGIAGCLILFWTIILVTTKLMSFASMLTCLVTVTIIWLVPATWGTNIEMNLISRIMICSIASIIFLKHYQNLFRLLKGEEKKLKFAK